MGHASQRTNGRLQQGMAGLALNVSYKAKTTVVPELIWMMQTRPHIPSLMCEICGQTILRAGGCKGGILQPDLYIKTANHSTQHKKMRQ
jgi:hypothetical protein